MSFALVTGASKGIGKSIAHELARRKLNILLVARDAQLLRENTAEIRLKYGVEVDFLAIYLTENQAVEKLVQWIGEKSYKFSVLVNNAGYGLSGPTEAYTFWEHKNMITLNMDVPVELTHRLAGDSAMNQKTPQFL